MRWDFGVYQCNILMIVAHSGSIGIPLYWELLDNKSGNSSCQNRQDLLMKLIGVIGVNRINVVIGDREFIGQEWIKFLKDNHISYCMRVPKSHLITLKNGNTFSIIELLENQSERYFHDCMVDGVWCNAMIKKLPSDDYLFLISDFPTKKIGAIYRKRWCIEVLFQTFKERGFDLESTHLKCPKKLSKLLVFVSIAVAICVKFGEYYHQKVQKIKVKPHGYKANSFFRKGLNIIRRGLKNPSNDFSQLWNKSFRTFTKWVNIQISYSQHFKEIFG